MGFKVVKILGCVIWGFKCVIRPKMCVIRGFKVVICLGCVIWGFKVVKILGCVIWGFKVVNFFFELRVEGSTPFS